MDAETHIVALLPDDWNGRFLMGGGGGMRDAPGWASICMIAPLVHASSIQAR